MKNITLYDKKIHARNGLKSNMKKKGETRKMKIYDENYKGLEQMIEKSFDDTEKMMNIVVNYEIPKKTGEFYQKVYEQMLDLFDKDKAWEATKMFVKKFYARIDENDWYY